MIVVRAGLSSTSKCLIALAAAGRKPLTVISPLMAPPASRKAPPLSRLRAKFLRLIDLAAGNAETAVVSLAYPILNCSSTWRVISILVCF